MEIKKCDKCKKEIEYAKITLFDNRVLKNKRLDFCSKKCFVDYVKKNYIKRE